MRHIEVRDPLRAIKRRVPRPMRRLARYALRKYALRTADRRVLPDFLIIGAKRGGTTSLWNWLVRHPGVAPMFPATQQLKSPHYFDINFAHGERWYRAHFPTRKARGELLCGEASPYYLFHPLAADRAHTTLPEAKIIVSLRNPVDRAYSNYWERRGSGAEPLTSFEDALIAEPTRLDGEEARIRADARHYSANHDCHSYLARGRYLDQLRPWFDRFDPAQILVLRFEDLVADEAGVYARVQQFLGLRTTPPPPAARYNRLPAPPMSDATRAWLIDYYAPHNAALQEFLGLTFDWDK